MLRAGRGLLRDQLKKVSDSFHADIQATTASLLSGTFTLRPAASVFQGWPQISLWLTVLEIAVPTILLLQL